VRLWLSVSKTTQKVAGGFLSKFWKSLILEQLIRSGGSALRFSIFVPTRRTETTEDILTVMVSLCGVSQMLSECVAQISYFSTLLR